MVGPSWIVLLLSLASCSAVQIKSSLSNNSSISFEKQNKNHDKSIDVKVTKDFFLWGLVPRQHEIILEKELGNKGYSEVSEFNIIQKNSSIDFLWMVLTFGVYYPQTYHLKGKSYIK